MTVILAPDEFQFLADLLKQRSGLALTPDKGYLLDTRLTPIAKANGLADLRELVAKLREGKQAIVLCADSLDEEVPALREIEKQQGLTDGAKGVQGN